MEANEYILQKAATILRGMTWTGMVYNMFSKESPPADVLGRQVPIHDAADGYTSIKSLQFQGDLAGKDSLSAKKAMNDGRSEEQMLSELLSSVTDLHDIGVQMGVQIDQQNFISDRFEDKTSRVADQMLDVTLKASQLTLNLRKSDEGFLGTYQFIERNSGRFLSVDDTRIVLVPNEDLSTLFFCYLKETSIYGLQNAKTLKFLCSSVWGPILAQGCSFGRREECHLSLSEDSTGLYFLQTHWGTGGWLKQSIRNDGKNEVKEVLDIATANISDRKDMLLLKPVLVGGPINGHKGMCPTIGTVHSPT